ncbi:basic amino acid/polyamine antiporter [Rhizobium sp. TRM96647]|uniref:basic amino acid/polyamine antiporter n=1 Tax=unclassified Rhizobium TaxID=2613769 RepID=UPI0021E9561F|nr:MULTISPECIES: basic amino acid/polyamine antiporter [unclassified Rhizobium]MCV3737288.1 basic amino acid/polyamine antiporter [Rhizobium sp. TRM96647]MCV3759272.1 basic amino acid/polyamine antiporter [Rhizobium sp. TRM96650]
MAQDTPQKFSLWTLTAMVVGSMVGAGIFSLPQAFGRATGPFGALIAWTIAGIGMLMLALVFQTLSRRKPDLDAGIYAYAKAGFGNYPGFLSALGYWSAAVLGNVSYFILIKSTLGLFFPVFGDGNTVPAIVISSALLWFMHTLILRGIREAAALNTIVTFAKLIPILLFVVFVALGFKSDVFSASFWGGEEVSLATVAGQVRATMLVTVFVFVGIEGASVYSRYARRRSDVGLATLMGFLGVLCLMVLVTLLSYGVLLRPDLAALRNPSMAGVLEAVVGPWGAVFVAVGLLISVAGAYISWVLLAAEILYSASKYETMPRFLSHENSRGVPSNALWLTNIIVQIFLILTLFTEYAFRLALELTSSMILIPYFLVAAYGAKLAFSGDTYGRDPTARRADLARAAIATIYTAGLVYAAGAQHLLLTTVIYGPGTILYLIARREQGKRAFTPPELALFILAALGACAGLYMIVTGGVA